MQATSPTDRRTFLASAAAGTAAVALSATSYARVVGANDRISIGVIGCGQRGYGAHMPGVHKHAESQNVEITAICDVWQPRRERAAAKVQEWYGRAPRVFSAFEELLALPDVDAIMIASCDFQHCMHLEAAAKARKDAYCEKPLAMNMEELRRACDAVAASKIIVQMGTQSRSDPVIVGCREVYRTDVLGTVSRIEEFRNGNRPNWYKRLDLEIKESEVDWREFLRPLPYRPFSARLFTGWYGYREFCGGSIPQFMSHFIDLVHFVTGAKFPSSAVAHGDTFTWKDENNFNCPDQVETSLIYPEGFMVCFVTNFGNASGNRTVFFGTQGIIDLSVRKNAFVSPAGAFTRDRIKKEMPIQPVPCPDHFLDWLQCLRTRQRPVAPIESGYQHSVACLMSEIAWATGRRQVYEPEQREIRPG